MKSEEVLDPLSTERLECTFIPSQTSAMCVRWAGVREEKNSEQDSPFPFSSVVDSQ